MSMLDVQKPNLSPTSHLSPTSPTMRKRQRTLDHVGNAAPGEGHAIPLSGPAAVGDDGFINDNDAVDSAGDDDDDEEKPKDKKAGRRKIKIEYIQDKSRRHITFSKRKAGMLFHNKLPYYPSHMPIYRHYEKGNIYSRFVHPLLSHLSLIGLRTLNSYRNSSSFARRFRDRSRLHFYHRQTPTSRYSTRGKESYSSLSKCSSRLSTILTASRYPTWSSFGLNEYVRPSTECQYPRRSLNQWSSNWKYSQRRRSRRRTPR